MEGVRIAMWSGPRNISTAMMRSFGSRLDCFVTDEPLYANYLQQTGVDHPGRDQIIEHHETDPAKVIDWLTGPIPGGNRIWYQKHMTHHILPQLDTGWFKQVRHAFLIRQPEAMLTSLTKVLGEVTLEETGLPLQADLYYRVIELTGSVPPVVDSKDVRTDPEGVLTQLCERLDIPWDPAMLSWNPGPRDTDGVWAPHWYANVEKSTGFAPFKPKDERVPESMKPLLGKAQALYDRLAEHRITTPVTASST